MEVTWIQTGDTFLAVPPTGLKIFMEHPQMEYNIILSTVIET